MAKQSEIVADNGALRIAKMELGPFGANAYLLTCLATGESVLIDAPAEPSVMIGRLESAGLTLILLTHSHVDHTGALEELRSHFKTPLGAHAAERSLPGLPPDRLLAGGDELSCGKVRLRVLHTPGHTPGSLCFYTEGYLLAGDTIFPGGPGRTASPDDFKAIIKSIYEQLFNLPGETLVFPGHGAATVLAREKEQFAVFTARPQRPDLCGDLLWLSS